MKILDHICEQDHDKFHCRDENHVGHQLKALDLLFKRNMESIIRKNGFESMSVINVWIIRYLMSNIDIDIFQKDIEKKFNIGKSSIAGTLKVMEEKDIIIRKSVEGDARLKKVCLTEKGKQYADKLEQGRISVEQKVSAGISEDDMNHFFDIIKKMQENLKEKE